MVVAERPRWLVAAVFGALLLAHVSFRNEFERFRQPNGMSRLFLTLALAEEGRLDVDGLVARYGPVEDLAQHEGRYYSDKPPGSAILMAPVAFLLRQTILPASPDPLPMLVALRLLCVSLPAVLFWYFTRTFWYELAGTVERGLAVILAGGLGSIFFLYATESFAHVQAAILAFAGFLAIRGGARSPSGGGRDESLRVALAGLCLGWALITDYVLLLAVPVLAIYAVFIRPGARGRRLVALAAGALPPVLVVGLYNDACFGDPMSVGFHHLVDPRYRAGYASGLLGIQPPDPRGLLEIALLPRRGIAYLSPVLLLAPLGFWRASGRPIRAEGVAAFAASLAIFLFAATTVDWTGGWGTGCRYLVPAIPFLLVGVAASVRDVAATSAASIAFRAFTCVGFVTIGLAAASFPYFPPEYESPIFQLALPLLLAGHPMPGLLGGSGSDTGALLFAPIVVAAAVFVLTGSWPRIELRGNRSTLVAGILAVAVLLAMALTAPPAASEIHQRALGLILHILGG